MSEESIEDLKAQLTCMQEKLEAKEREVEQLVHEVKMLRMWRRRLKKNVLKQYLMLIVYNKS